MAEFDASVFDLRIIAKETGITFKNNTDEEIELLNSLANDKDTGFNVLHYLAHHQNKTIRESVAWNSNTLTSTLRMLWKEDESEDVLGGIATNPNTPLNILREAVHCKKGEGYVQYCTSLYRGDMPDDVARVLLDSPISVVVEALAANIKIPEFAYAELLKYAEKYNEPEVLHNLVRNYNCPAPILMSLIRDDKLAKDIAQHHNTPIIGLTFLAKHKDKEVKNEALNNKNLPTSVRTKQKEDARDADRTSTRETILKLINMIPQKTVEERVTLAGKDYLDISIMSMLSYDSSKEVRVAVAANPRTPISLLERLASDEELDVLIALLERQSIPDYLTGFIMDNIGND